MEDWLNESFNIKYNLASSGCEDLYLKEFLNLINEDLESFNELYLGDNDTRGSLKLRLEICKSYNNVDVENVMVTNGTSEALFTFFNEILEKNDEVIIPFPAFQCLYEIPVSIGCSIKFLNLLESKPWRLDLEKLDKLVTPKTKLIIINNPHNPIGFTLNEKELYEIGEIAKKNDCYLLFDEHYRYLPLYEGNDLIPSGYDICSQINNKTYATGSMIKCFGIVGIRIGWIIGENNILSRCRDYKDYLTHSIPSITDHLAYLALKNKDKIIAMRKRNILKNVMVLNDFMKKHNDYIDYQEPEGGVVCFPKLKNKIVSKKFCETLSKEFQVSLLPGFAFEVDNHFRINFGIESNKFNKAIRLIENFLDV
jgi:aspartate/methionine/tyrosine aminotransferase